MTHEVLTSDAGPAVVDGRQAPVVRMIATAMAAVAVLGTLAFTWSTVAVDRGESGYSPWWDGQLYLIVLGLSSALAVLRAVTSRVERGTWIAVAIGQIGWTTASALFNYHDQFLDPFPTPAVSDVVFYASYPAFYIGLLFGARRRGRLLGSGWLDALVAGSGLAAVAGAVLLGPIVREQSHPAELILALAYPVLDIILVMVAFAAVVRRAGRIGWSSGVLTVGLVIYGVSDAVFAYAVATGGYQAGTVLDAGWLVGQLVIGIAAFLPDPSGPQRRHPAPLHLSLVSAVAALGIVAVGTVADIPAAATGFAVVCLAGALVRSVLARREVRQLHDSFRLARTDDLTGLPNRRALLERLEQTIAEATPTSLILLDLDGFKEVNDSLGHDVGDRLLCAVAGRLSGALPAGTFLARLGGDEFGIATERSTDEAGMLAADIGRALTVPFVLDGIVVRVTGAFGVCSFPDPAGDPRDLLKFTDVAMYRAKQQRVTVALYEPEADEVRRARLEMIDDLRFALERDELTLFLQPIVDSRSRVVVGAEALVRWEHPRHGLLTPETFIGFVEQAGVMHLLTRWMLEHAIEAAARWRRYDPEAHVSVNIAGSDLVDDALPGIVAGHLHTFGLPGEALMLEITETSLIPDSDRAQRCIRRLREQGVRVAIDDFGTGYSSMTQLLELEIDQLKVDRSFVAGVVDDERARAIVAATVQLARALDLQLVAEGVDRPEVLDYMIVLGCTRAQGYLFAQPLIAGDLLAVVERSGIGLVLPVAGIPARSSGSPL